MYNQEGRNRGGWIHLQTALNPQSGAKQLQTPSLAHLVGGDTNSDEKWEIVMTKTNRRNKPSSKPEVPLQNPFMVFQTEKEKKKQLR